MILDYENTPLTPSTPYDVCIVGAGAAGILIGVTLARANIKVIMLEGGGRTAEDRSDAIYHVNVIGHAHTGVTEGRRRIFGGTTTAWGGQILPLTPMDFEKRDWVPGSGWPIEHKSLTSYYEQAMVFEGLGSSIHNDEEVWDAFNVKPGDFSPGFEAYLSRWCPEPDFARMYRAEIQDFQNLHLILHANVVGIDTDSASGQIKNVVCRGYGGTESKVTAKQFILCMGGLETVRLLLQPPRRGAKKPWSASDHLGRHFQDHIGCTVGKLRAGNHFDLHKIFDNYYSKGIKYHPRIRVSDQLQREQRILNSAVYLVHRSKANENLLAAKRILKGIRRGDLSSIQLQDVATAASAGVVLARQAARLAVKRRAYNPDDLGIEVHVSSEQLPLSDSKITVSNEYDALGLLRVNLDWQIAPAEVESIANVGRALVKLFAARGWAQLDLDPDLLNDPEAFAERVSDYYHHMGGARMSDHPSTGVVDTNLRLHGTTNGYVCSASVFPTSGFSNPTHTVLALGMRLSQHLIELSSHRPANVVTLMSEATSETV